MDLNQKKIAHTQQIRRITNVALEDNEFLAAITGYENKPIVSIEEAVKPLTSIVYMVETQATVAKNICKRRRTDLEADKAAAIMLYTMSWEPYEKCLFPMLNDALRLKNRSILRSWFLYLKLFFVALDDLPVAVNQRLFRGVKKDLSHLYKLGQPVIWWGFSSCSTDEYVAKREEYCGKTGKRTIFIIDSISGKNIRDYSYFQEEDEMLLLPATQFQVVECYEREPDFYEIHLKEMDASHSLRAPLPYRVRPCS